MRGDSALTDYGYMIEKVQAFTHDLDLAARENTSPILQRVWYRLSTDDYYFDDPVTLTFIHRFDKLSFWEKANVMYEMSKQIEVAAKAAAKRFAGEAREADRGGINVGCEVPGSPGRSEDVCEVVGSAGESGGADSAP